MELQMYDEDLSQNPFFLCLQQQYPQLFEKITNNRWTIAVPRLGCVGSYGDLTQSDLESHILIGDPEKEGFYMTPNDKEVKIENNMVITQEGFDATISATILFEETFFNAQDESYCVLCINQSLEPLAFGAVVSQGSQGASFSIKGLDDCAEVLWGSKANKNMKTEQLVADIIEQFHNNLLKMEGHPYDLYVQSCQSLFNKVLTVVMKDSKNKAKVQQDAGWADSIKAAIETYVTHRIFRRLYRAIRTSFWKKDSALNKITRNVKRELQLKDLGVKMEFCQNVPRARKELANLLRYSTPLGKLHCLHRVVRAITTQPYAGTKQGRTMPIGTDDLLPILIFLVIKADMPNWWANFKYMSNFRFGRSSNDDEYGFYLASLEAALEHVSSGDIENGVPFSSRTIIAAVLGGTSPETSIWSSQEKSSSSAIQKFFQAVTEGDKDSVLSLLDATFSPKETSPSGCHPLCTCQDCRSALQTKTEHKEQMTVDVMSKDDKGNSALHVAAEHGHVELLDLLIRRGASINTTDYSNATPLHKACLYGQQRIALLLLDFKADPNTQDNDGNSPLHLATQHGHDGCVKALVYLDQGSTSLDMDLPNDFGDRPLHLAAKWGFLTICEILLENGASVAVRNRQNLSPKQLAHNALIASIILKAAEEQGLRGKPEETEGKPDATERKLRRHSTPVTPSASKPPLKTTSASFKKPTKRTSQKRQTVADSNVEKLLKAVVDGDIHMVRFHLGWQDEEEEEEEEASPSSPKVLCHPLCQCDKCKPLQKFTAPSASGLHVNIATSDGVTPLHSAVRHGHMHLVELLVRRGANVNARTGAHQASPVHIACRHNQMKAVQFLHSKHATLGLKDYQGNAPIHYTCQYGHHSILAILIQYGASVNGTNKKGNTPLHEATKWNFEGCVMPLLQAGANLHAVNKLGQTPLQSTQNERIAHLLREALNRENRVKRGLPSSQSGFPNRYDAASQSLLSSVPSHKPSLQPTKSLPPTNKLSQTIATPSISKTLDQLSNPSENVQLSHESKQQSSNTSNSSELSNTSVPSTSDSAKNAEPFEVFSPSGRLRRSHTLGSCDSASFDTSLSLTASDWPMEEDTDDWEDLTDAVPVETLKTDKHKHDAQDVPVENQDVENTSKTGQNHNNSVTNRNTNQIYQPENINDEIKKTQSENDQNQKQIEIQEKVSNVDEHIQTTVENSQTSVEIPSGRLMPHHERQGSVASKSSSKSLNFVSDHYGSESEEGDSEDSTTESLRDQTLE